MKFASLPFLAVTAVLAQCVFAVVIPQVSSSIHDAEQNLVWNENAMEQPKMLVKSSLADATTVGRPITLEEELMSAFGWGKEISGLLTRFLDVVDRMHPGGSTHLAEFQNEVRQLVANAGYAYRSDRRVLTRMEQGPRYHESADEVAKFIVKLLKGLADAIDKLKESVKGIDFLTKLLNSVGLKLKGLILIIQLQIIKHQLGIK
ncbi:hypothetical protein [Absidia glauca]|uniref:Uncharacterized protein n=1 Tax=Absidia glauca TaxID=4829 RepID=A0A168N099_ABSGL|nr:hypothetical protein [Absidia glauca]